MKRERRAVGIGGQGVRRRAVHGIPWQRQRPGRRWEKDYRRPGAGIDSWRAPGLPQERLDRGTPSHFHSARNRVCSDSGRGFDCVTAACPPVPPLGTRDWPKHDLAGNGAANVRVPVCSGAAFEARETGFHRRARPCQIFLDFLVKPCREKPRAASLARRTETPRCAGRRSASFQAGAQGGGRSREDRRAIRRQLEAPRRGGYSQRFDNVGTGGVDWAPAHVRPDSRLDCFGQVRRTYIM